MNDIQPYRGALAVQHGQTRWLAKAMNGTEASKQLGLARIEAMAELQAVKADAVTYVGQRGMHNVAMVSKLEEQLALMCPQASGRLAMIADITAMAVADVVQRTAHEVNRTC